MKPQRRFRAFRNSCCHRHRNKRRCDRKDQIRLQFPARQAGRRIAAARKAEVMREPSLTRGICGNIMWAASDLDAGFDRLLPAATEEGVQFPFGVIGLADHRMNMVPPGGKCAHQARAVWPDPDGFGRVIQAYEEDASVGHAGGITPGGVLSSRTLRHPLPTDLRTGCPRLPRACLQPAGR